MARRSPPWRPGRSILAYSRKFLMNKPDASSESVWRLFALAVGFSLLEAVPAVLLGVAIVVFTRVSGRPELPPDVESWLFEMAQLAGYGIIFFTVYFRGRIVGHGDVRVGLGYEPVSQRPVISFMAILFGAYAILLMSVRYWAGPDFFSKQIIIGATSPWLSLLVALDMVLLAPLSEELFYRGWLWTGLRKHWGGFSTAALTSSVWIAGHFAGGAAVAIVLLPAAVILSIARHFGGSVRASLALHILYNFIIVISPWVLNTAGLL
jgi:membrane protease YdiL (CAAX protease family)